MQDENPEAHPAQHDEAEAEAKPVIVAIGASAGGVQALQAFIGALPQRSGAA